MSEPWASVQLSNEVYHVLPVNDLKVHEDGFMCWCKPTVQTVTNGKRLVTHNSADGREFWEDEDEIGH